MSDKKNGKPESENKKDVKLNKTKDFDRLYDYVKYNLLGYDKNQSLTRMQVLRLKGLKSGKFIENNSVKPCANYDYEVILIAFKACSVQILNALSNKKFNDENHKFNYIIKVVENNLNDIYKKVERARKANSDIKNSNDVIGTIDVEYNSELHKKNVGRNKYSYLCD